MSTQSERWRRPRRVAMLALMIVTLVAAGCGVQPGGEPRTSIPEATPSPIWTPTATATPAPSPTATPSPRPTPTPTSPPPAPPRVCVPAPGVRPVSPTVIVHGNTSRMQVSLTFDSDGGDIGHAMAYLDILRARGIHATFFLTGDFAAAHPDVVRRILADGNEIGNHTMDHPDLIHPLRSDSFICSELVRADQRIAAADGHTSRPFFRPPWGNYNDQVRSLAAGLGYRTVYWSIDPRDWDPATTTQDIINRVLHALGLKPGAIILMHVNSANEQYALDDVISGLEQRGYSIVPLSQLIR